jgi:hypothetical protein
VSLSHTVTWVPVSERLPDGDETVHVSNINTRQNEYGFMDRGKWYSTPDEHGDTYPIYPTHWAAPLKHPSECGYSLPKEWCALMADREAAIPHADNCAGNPSECGESDERLLLRAVESFLCFIEGSFDPFSEEGMETFNLAMEELTVAHVKAKNAAERSTR